MDKAVFIDRDGTLTPDIPYLDDPDLLRLFPRVSQAVSRLKRAGFKIVIITNQSGVGRGYFPLEVLEAVHTRLREMLQKGGADYDALYYCPHKPEDGCLCRKPATGMIDRAVDELSISLDHSYLVGDDTVDVQLARNSGVKSVLVMTGHGRDCRASITADAEAEDFAEAVDWILKDSSDYD